MDIDIRTYLVVSEAVVKHVITPYSFPYTNPFESEVCWLKNPNFLVPESIESHRSLLSFQFCCSYVNNIYIYILYYIYIYNIFSPNSKLLLFRIAL